MAEIIEGHIRDHVADPNRQPESGRSNTARMLIDIVRKYLK
jgi:DNA-binding FrmR family transcriptional regulator